MVLLEMAVACLLVLAGWFGHAAVSRRKLRAARRDPVTGLATRASWTPRASRILRRPGQVVGLADVDGFKDLNDTFGHLAGDEVLAWVGARMQAWLETSGGGECGRLGGDEFAFVTSEGITTRQLDDLARLMAQPVTLADGRVVQAGVSVGAVSFSPGAEGLSAALAGADAEMYAAKRSGGGARLSPGPYRLPSQGNGGPVRRTRHHGLAAIRAQGTSRVPADG